MTDRSWTRTQRFSEPYKKGVNDFMQHLRELYGVNALCMCPCRRCNNTVQQNLIDLEDHLHIFGIVKSYTCWVHHGERISDATTSAHVPFRSNEPCPPVNVAESDRLGGLGDMLEDVFGQSSSDIPNDAEYNRLLDDAQRELYPGRGDFSTLSFVVKLLHVKVYNRQSSKSFDMLMELLNDAFPHCNGLPKNHYEAMKMLKGLGLGYEKIHACEYDCALFYKENKDMNECPVCKSSRWKLNDGKKKKIPRKILRYFPLTPRLRRVYMSTKSAEDMTWHSKKRATNDPNSSVHVADGEAWKDFDRRFEWFGREPRNVRLGLATDGFNPFGNLSQSTSMWPVILTPYNLPPWKCMRDPYMFLSLLIPGPKSPGRDIDIYLRPLVDELKQLWTEGATVHDASTSQNFQMHVAVMWTIHDFPAYGDVSGWSTKGYLACPICKGETCSHRSVDKISYTGARLWLPVDHPYRRNKKFNGKIETRLRPKILTGSEVLGQLDSLSTSHLSGLSHQLGVPPPSSFTSDSTDPDVSSSPQQPSGD